MSKVPRHNYQGRAVRHLSWGQQNWRRILRRQIYRSSACQWRNYWGRHWSTCLGLSCLWKNCLSENRCLLPRHFCRGQSECCVCCCCLEGVEHRGRMVSRKQIWHRASQRGRWSFFFGFNLLLPWSVLNVLESFRDGKQCMKRLHRGERVKSKFFVPRAFFSSLYQTSQWMFCAHVSVKANSGWKHTRGCCPNYFAPEQRRGGMSTQSPPKNHSSTDLLWDEKIKTGCWITGETTEKKLKSKKENFLYLRLGSLEWTCHLVWRFYQALSSLFPDQ